MEGYILHRAKKVAIATITPTRTFGDVIDRAPLVLRPAAVEDGWGVASEVDGVDEGAAGEEDAGAPALLRALARSWGIIKGVDAAALRSIDPSSFITSALDAKKLRV